MQLYVGPNIRIESVPIAFFGNIVFGNINIGLLPEEDHHLSDAKYVRVLCKQIIPCK